MLPHHASPSSAYSCRLLALMEAVLWDLWHGREGVGRTVMHWAGLAQTDVGDSMWSCHLFLIEVNDRRGAKI